MDVKTVMEILKKDYGIENLDQLVEAMKNSKGIDISIFVSPKEDLSTL